MTKLHRMKLTAAQSDRALGVLIASAAGDALGAGYEFGSASFSGRPAMIGGGLGDFAVGEWTDDTAQAMAIAAVAATGADLRSTEALDAIAAHFAAWYAGNPPDVGIQTRAVLSRAGRHACAAEMAEAARQVHARSGRSAGNGSLMRTGPVALAHLDDPEALVAAARAISALTHHDPLAGDGAALWCLMIRHAVLVGELPTADDVLPLLSPAHDEPEVAGHDWAATLHEAETRAPSTFTTNGWVVGALQAAWSAIVQTPIPQDQSCRHLQDALATAIGIGNDTDTVAAIAGALLGARWGASAVPQEWQVALHGWDPAGEATTGRGAARLTTLGALTLGRGRPDRQGWPTSEAIDYTSWSLSPVCVPHPLVEGVWIGNALALDTLPAEIDAVVSLCRVGTTQVPAHLLAAEVRLIDSVPQENPNADFVIDDAARTVLRLRDAGHRVFLHCVAGQSRTPTVAARVAVLDGQPGSGPGLDDVVRAVVGVLPGARPQRWLVDCLHRLG